MRSAAVVLATAALLLACGPAARAADPQIGSARAIRIADRVPKVVEERVRDGALTPSATMVDGSWEVAYFAGEKEVALVVVDPTSGAVSESWTGYQVAWKMARGYPGAFGHRLNAPYVFLPLCALFLLGLVDWRRLRRLANLDLAVLLGFGVSNYFFNRAQIGVSVPLAYPVLAYLLVRMIWIGFRGGRPLRPVWPAAWLLVAALFLMGLRVGLDVADSGVIDVGYASVVGADRVVHGEQLYDNFPEDVSQGDTYGPVNYYAYVPTDLVWPWSGRWDDLPAAHGAAVLFDVAAFGLLFLLGRRLRPGPAGFELGSTLAFGWAAYPYTAYALESNSNDALVAALLVGLLLVAARPAARGAVAALAGLTKFAPLLLAPLLATCGGRPRTGRYLAGFAIAAAAAMAWAAVDPGLPTFYQRTIAYQAGRDSPFSIWGQAPSLEPLRIALAIGTLGAALGFAFRPRRKTLRQVAALGAALLIGAQLTAEHWFYLYVVWFYPFLLVALALGGEVPEARPPNGVRSSGAPKGWGRAR